MSRSDRIRPKRKIRRIRRKKAGEIRVWAGRMGKGALGLALLASLTLLGFTAHEYFKRSVPLNVGEVSIMGCMNVTESELVNLAHVDFKASLAPDYIAIDKIQKGATMGIVFPKEMLVVPSPIAIFKGTPNLKAAQKFVDFLLSKEGQSIVAGEGTLPIRADVTVDKKHGLPPADEAVKRAMKVDYLKVMDEKESIIQKFQQIMR